MANVTITIPDAMVPRLRNMMRSSFPEHEALSDADAFKRITADYWRQMLAQYERIETELALKAQAAEAVELAYQQALTDGKDIG